MRLLILGAGASYAECEAAGLPDDLRLPLMKNFAAKMWADFNPYDLLSMYLMERGVEVHGDARLVFMEHERQDAQRINVESFFEYAYRHRELVLPGCENYSPASLYENLLYHGILNPLVHMLCLGLFKDGVEDAFLPLSKAMAGMLHPGDYVINLNYDPIFEIAAEQVGHKLVFVPNTPSRDAIMICKPHGSMNLISNEAEGRFYFAKPYFAGSVQPGNGGTNYRTLIPPRRDKRYVQHPVGEMILRAVRRIRPKHMVFWGIGFTGSDFDLFSKFSRWSFSASKIDFINPSLRDVERASEILRFRVDHFADAPSWLAAHKS